MQANILCWLHWSITFESAAGFFCLSSILFKALWDFPLTSTFAYLFFFPKVISCLTNVDSVMVEIPSYKWRSINLNNAVLHQCFGSDQFVIGGIVNDVENSGFSCYSFRSPVEVTFFDSKGSEFEVSSSHSDPSYSCFIIDQLCVGNRSSLLKGSFLFVNWHAPTCQSSLVPWISRYTHYH